MSFQAALNNVLATEQPSHLQTAEEITTRNFIEDCATHNILIHKLQFGGFKEDHFIDEDLNHFQQTVQRAYVTVYMPKHMSQEFIDNINLEGNVIAEKIKFVRDDLYDTIYPSLIHNIPTSYKRTHTDYQSLSSVHFEVDSIYDILVTKTNYEYFLSEHNITNYQDIDFVLIFDPKSGREANAYPGLFSEIGRAVRRIIDEHH